MGPRTSLQAEFEDILGSKHVYFQPPESVKLSYPCIVYNRGTERILRSDNGLHKIFHRYNVTLIYRDPDSNLPDKMLEIPYCSHVRHYVADNLYHEAYDLYY